ncbi:sensor histidine kinase [Mucilaginibacter antarcticus]
MPVTITYVYDNASVTVRVKDQGFGIPKNEIDKVFDRFYRSEDVREHHISGFGIGLYLCYEIINLHNGTVDVVSIPGKGSTFSFTLPF